MRILAQVRTQRACQIRQGAKFGKKHMAATGVYAIRKKPKLSSCYCIFFHARLRKHPKRQRIALSKSSQWNWCEIRQEAHGTTKLSEKIHANCFQYFVKIHHRLYENRILRHFLSCPSAERSEKADHLTIEKLRVTYLISLFVANLTRSTYS